MSLKNRNIIKSNEQEIADSEISYPRICIVPSIKEYIDAQSTISDDLLDFYELQVASLIERPPGYKINVNGFVSEYKEKYYHPFDIAIYGSYPLMTHWFNLKNTIKIAIDKMEQDKYIDKALAKDPDYHPIDFSQYKKDKVLERLKEYAIGFKYGFDNFITTFIDSPSAIVANTEYKIQRVIDILTGHLSETVSFQEIKIGDDSDQRLRKWYEDGVKAGYNYHAWYYVFFNHSLFESYFVKQETKNTIPELSSIFNVNNNAFETCIALFEYLEITLNGVRNITGGRGGKLFGLIIAIKQTPGMLKANLTEQQLLAYFNSHLGTNFKAIPKRGKYYEEALDDAKTYLKKNFKKTII